MLPRLFDLLFHGEEPLRQGRADSLLCNGVDDVLPLAVQMEQDSLAALDGLVDACIPCWCSFEIVSVTKQRVFDGLEAYRMVLTACAHFRRDTREIRSTLRTLPLVHSRHGACALWAARQASKKTLH